VARGHFLASHQCVKCKDPKALTDLVKQPPHVAPCRRLSWHPVGTSRAIDIDGVGLRPVAWQVPTSPSIGLAVVAEQISAVPSGDPQPSATVAPDAPAPCRGTGGSKTVVVPVSTRPHSSLAFGTMACTVLHFRRSRKLAFASFAPALLSDG
jgi:hypothetical protein